MARTWVAALAALVVACGGGGTGSDGGGIESPGDGGGGGGGGGDGGGEVGGACTGPVTVKLEVVDFGHFATLELDVKGIALENDGAAVDPDWSASGTVAFQPGEAHRLATFQLPKGAVVDGKLLVRAVRACLVTEHCLSMDPCTSPIAFRVDFWKVRDRCTAVLRLDLDKSVHTDREAWAFLPRFALHY